MKNHVAPAAAETSLALESHPQSTPATPIKKAGLQASPQSSSGRHIVKSNRPSATIEHIRSHYSNYLGSTQGAKSTEHNSGGVGVLMRELLHNSIDEYLQGYGGIIEIHSNAETITIRDYGRGIPFERLRRAIQEPGKSSKMNSEEIRFCEGLNGLGLKLAHALSSRFLLRSYRQQTFDEIESAEGVILRDRRGRCEKEDGTFIRFTPAPQIFGTQLVNIPQLFEIICQMVALHPGLEIRFNHKHLVARKGLGDLYQLLPQWSKQNYLYESRSLQGQNWQLSFAHLAEWQSNSGGLHNERLVHSFVNGHAPAGGLTGGLHMRQLQGAFLSVLRQAFPQKEVDAFWDKGITLFWSLNLVAPHFQGSGKTHLVGAESELAAIAEECREQLWELFSQDDELKSALGKLLDDCSSAGKQEDYGIWQSRLSGGLRQVEERADELNQMLRDSERKYVDLDDRLRTSLDESEEIQKHWKDVAGHLTVDLARTGNEFAQLKKLQRAEQRRYRKEQEKRLEALEGEQQVYQKLKQGLAQQAKVQLAKEKQRGELIDGSLQNWNRLQASLESAEALRKQWDLEQEQIVQYLQGAKASTETEVRIAKENIKLSEQKMLQRQENYLQNFQENALSEFETIHDEITDRKQELRSALDEEQDKAYDKLAKLHQSFSASLEEKDKLWQERLAQVDQNVASEWQQHTEQRKLVLADLDKSWREQEAVLERQRKKHEGFLESWETQLKDGRRELEAHQNACGELTRNRKELEVFLSEQKSAHEEQLGMQKEWDRRWAEHTQTVEQLFAQQLESLEVLGRKLERDAEQEMQQRLSAWLEHFEKFSRDGENNIVAQQKLLATKQQTLENEFALVEQEKNRLKSAWEQHYNKELLEFESYFEKLKEKQHAHQDRIDATQDEQARLLEDIEASMADLRSSSDRQFAAVEQSVQDQAMLYRQGLLEREQDLRKSLDDFAVVLKEKQREQLVQELDQWGEKFLEEQSHKDRLAAEEAQRKRSQFWQEQQSLNRDEAEQQRREFYESHKQLQGTMERERERLHKELEHLQDLTQQQEDTLENLNQSLMRNVEQRSERLKQEMEENYRQFYEEILGNTRELHQITSDERKVLRSDLSNMRREVDDLSATVNYSEQTLASVQKALPDSLKLQDSLEDLAEKEAILRKVDQEIVQLQGTLNENSVLGQKTSEQLAVLL
ncbi:MAG: ATP-binding protein, partial [Spirochaetota bacterium]